MQCQPAVGEHSRPRAHGYPVHNTAGFSTRQREQHQPAELCGTTGQMQQSYPGELNVMAGGMGHACK